METHTGSRLFWKQPAFLYIPGVQVYLSRSRRTQHLGVKLISSHLRVLQGPKQGMEATGPPDGEFHKTIYVFFLPCCKEHFSSLNMQSHHGKYHELILVMQPGDT